MPLACPYSLNVLKLLLLLLASPFSSMQTHQMDLFVSPSGNDANQGTPARPLGTLQAAQTKARTGLQQGEAVTVWLRAGTYYLDKTLVLEPEDSGLKIRAYKNEHPVISGGFQIHPEWTSYREGIFKTQLPPGTDTDQLFVNGVAQPLARYPNFDPDAKFFNGVAADVLDPQRVARWKHPEGAFLHALHAYEWGDVHYQITGKDKDGKLTMEGGWQNNRQAGMKKDVRFIEGIFEELDAPGEWFLDKSSHTLYYYPPQNLNLAAATIEGVHLKSLVEMRGSKLAPVHDITLEGLTFRQVARTFMQNKEPLLRSDWTIYRGGAVFATGTEDSKIQDCFFDAVGGNAVFVSNYNRGLTIQGCRIENAGANGVAFVGSPKAVRSPLFEYNERHTYAEIDHNAGPLTDDYPSNCIVDDCLIDRIGRIEKQSAGVEISMSRGITVRHCSIYDVPRAGINIGDGCWGGHLIEYCDVFDTVKETGDHGSFNSWGRDRYWGLKDVDLNNLDKDGKSKLPLLDAVAPITLFNNRWRCDHGWDIDLDDGSSNFRIINNLCLNGGLKLREGFHRVCENNVIVDNSFHIHVWFKDSHDAIRHNIVFTPYQVIQVPPPWGDPTDFNLLQTSGLSTAVKAAKLAEESGGDQHSISVDAQFVDPSQGDYRVKPGSPALRLGFKNFPMDQFGVVKLELKRLARTPKLPGGAEPDAENPKRDGHSFEWLGAECKNLIGLGERSATGMGAERGVLVLSVKTGSKAQQIGLKPLDVSLGLNVLRL